MYASVRLTSTAFARCDPIYPDTVTLYGNFRSTATNNVTAYSITGSSGFAITGSGTAGASLSVSLVEVSSSNVLAAWSTGFSGPAAQGFLFDGMSAPNVGSWTGLLASGVQYDFLWSYTLTIAPAPFESTMVSLSPAFGETSNWLQIDFSQVPTPGGAALLGLAAASVCRRRRS